MVEQKNDKQATVVCLEYIYTTIKRRLCFNSRSDDAARGHRLKDLSTFIFCISLSLPMRTFLDWLHRIVFELFVRWKPEGKPNNSVEEWTRSEDEMTRFWVWTRTQALVRWQQELRAAFATYQTTLQHNGYHAPDIHRKDIIFTKGPQTRQIIFTCKQHLHCTADFANLHEYFAQRLIALGYTLTSADKHTCHRTGREMTAVRYYLKPPCRVDEQKRLEQVFGNITLLLYSVNGVPTELDVKAARFRDKMFAPPASLEKLVAALS